MHSMLQPLKIDKGLGHHLTSSIFTIALLLAFEIKHLLADYFFQPMSWLKTKHRYISIGGIQHAALHGCMTLPILLLFGYSAKLSLAVSLAEILIHYHIDWGKARLTEYKKWTITDTDYWKVFGFDQMLHKLTYFAIVFALLMCAS